MPIIDHNEVPESTWRPNYRKWDWVGPAQGVSLTLSFSTVGRGAGAPLHTHEADELIVLLDGRLEVRIGDEVHDVGPEHTLVVPARVPHGFKSIGSKDARILGFFGVPNAFEHTKYLEGGPAEPHGG